ncbi:MAG: hypothetical protein N2505_04445, partial [Endomicrobia bacterium]|nr:hypothetical protein [Endomicrobiia bacterium]
MSVILYSFLILFSILSVPLLSQQIDTTTVTMEDIISEETKPLQFRFEYIPKEIETPNVEYEDIEISYNQYISSDIMKIRPNYKFLIPYKLKKDAKVLLGGKDNYLISADVKNLQENGNLNFSIKSEKFSVVKNNVNDYYINLGYYLNYSKIFNNFVFTNSLSYNNQFLNNSSRQINYDIEINKIFSPNIILSLLTSFQQNFIEYKNNTFDNLFIKGNAKLESIINNKMMTGFNIEFFSNNSILFTTGVTFKNYIIDNSYLNFILSTDKNTKHFYYQIEFCKEFYNFNFSINYEKKLYFEFIRDYFIKFPQVLYKEIIYFPEIKAFETSLEYKYKNYKINFLFDSIFYNYYPTYSFSNNTTELCFIEDQHLTYLIIKFSVLIRNLIFNYNLNYLIFPKEVLFTTPIISEVSLEGNMFKNVLLKQKFSYNSRTLTNFYNYLEDRVISTT